ncbi:hypothetical protein JTB14_019754 [Gonioctena quinquepunctata]|nr:hypothetical protein JTB14_019754 [Gonioctena quinquepunctata]
MNNIFFNKLEISPPATCSSHAGLLTNTNKEKQNTSNRNKENVPDPSENSAINSKGEAYESTFSRKRKVAANAVERRQQEEIQRQDRFLNCFEDFVNTYKS